MNDIVFSDLVDAYYMPLYRFALSLTRNKADASDLTQQTFYVWATKGDSLRDPEKVKSWLFTTLYREFLRKHRRESRTSSFGNLPPGEQDCADPAVNDVAKLDSGIVMEALQSLDPVYRSPITLFYLQEFSYRQIAEIHGIPIGTVMSRIYRGKAHLRNALNLRMGDSREPESEPAQRPSECLTGAALSAGITGCAMLC